MSSRGGPRATARWRAPGRVNLIGEHTDYNDGFALPFALQVGCTAEISPRADDRLVVRSRQLRDAVELNIADLAPGSGGWVDYVAGVVWTLARRGHPVGGGVDIVIDSDVPRGAGLSSSAALVCSVTTALDELFGLGLSADELLAVTRAAENDYVGAPTGGMDQLASLRATDGHALLCDMRSLQTEQVPFDVAAAGLCVLVVDSRVEHAHADGEYRRRREGCERAAAILGVPALRDVASADLDAALRRLPDDELRRYVRHVVTEDERVLQVAGLLRADRPAEIGALLDESHASMREDYRITTPEIDVAADTLRHVGAVGARMTGGGFGGCVIALLADELVDEAVTAVRRTYAERGFTAPAEMVVRPARGAHRVEEPR